QLICTRASVNEGGVGIAIFSATSRFAPIILRQARGFDPMAELTPEELRRQTLLHIESLRAAGVEWLPKASPRQPRTPEPVGANLFEAPLPVAPSTALSADQRRQDLTVLAQRVKSCTRCGELAATRTQTVFGVGRVEPDICFIGEAPGADEDQQGEPFVGA